MRYLFCFCFILASFAWQAHSQTLGEVLRATQNRTRLLDEGRANGTWPLIEWQGVSHDPSDAEVNGLSVQGQMALLKQAWYCVEQMANPFIDARCFSSGVGKLTKVHFDQIRPIFSAENCPTLLQVLARRLRCLTTVSWNNVERLELEEGEIDYVDTEDLTSLPATLQLTEESIAVDEGWRYEVYDEQTGDYLGIRYSFVYTMQQGYKKLRFHGSKNFPGTAQIFINPDYANNQFQGLTWPALPGGDGTTNTLYHPGIQRWFQHNLQPETDYEIIPPGIFGSKPAAVSVSGEWMPISPDPNNNFYVFKPAFIDQPNISATDLWSSPPYPFYKIRPPAGIGIFSREDIFTADFGNEFMSDLRLPPQPALDLQLKQKLRQKELYISLNDPKNGSCEMVWDFSYIWDPDDFDNESSMRRSLSTRNVLSVRGDGQWDAVFSGKPEDRESEIEWGDVEAQQEGRRDFLYYIYEWWRPVLTQVVTPSMGVNITQVNRFKYRLDFYLRDQVRAKNATTGRYAFFGQPFQTWTAENPLSDYSEMNEFRLTTSEGAAYDLSRSETLDGLPESTTTDIDSTTYTLTGKDGGHTFLSTNIEVDGIDYADRLEATENTSVDGQNLPELKTSFYLRDNSYPDIEEIHESGSEGTRVTTYSYVHPSGGSQYLANETQTGGPNPYSVTFNGAELPTKVQDGAWSEIIGGYGGSTVSRLEKLGTTAIKTTLTAYSEGFRKAVTTTSQAGAVPRTVEYYAGTDTIFPWGPKLVRDFDATLTTWSYAWEGTNFVATVETGGGINSTATTVNAGTRTVTKTNSAGHIYSTEVFDIESGAKIDYAVVTAYQSDTPFPSAFDRPQGTTEQFAYDGQGRVTSHTDRWGKTTTYDRDTIGRLDEVTRAGLTWNITYNPGHLGATITGGGRSWAEQVSPFGGSYSLTIQGPENVTFTRSETASSIQTAMTNATTHRSFTQTTQKSSNLSTAITGNIVEPMSMSFNASALKWTMDWGAGLTASTTINGFGWLKAQTLPSANGSGTASLSYVYTNGQLSSATDSDGTTFFQFTPDGVLKRISRDGRFLAWDRQVSSTAQINWRLTGSDGPDNASATLLDVAYTAATGKLEQTPRGKTGQKITSTPSISGDVLTVATTGPGLSQSLSWKDGTFSAATLQDAGASLGLSATANAFGEITTLKTSYGGTGSGNDQTLTLSPLGLPDGITGLLPASFTNTFAADGKFTSTRTRNGHAQSVSFAPQGYLLSDGGYSKADAAWSAPALGPVITRTLTTGVGTADFKWSPVGTLKDRKFPDGSGETFFYTAAGSLTSSQTPSGTINYTGLNAFGQPDTVTGPGGTLASGIVYDGAGRLTALTDRAGAHSYSFVDGESDVDTHTSGPLAGQSLDRGYDALGNLQSVALSGGVSVGYTTTSGKLQTVTTAGGATGTWTNYDAVSGKAKNFTLGPLSVTTSYNGVGRVLSRASTAAGLTSTYGYGHTNDNNVQTLSTPQGAWTFANGSLGPLASATRTGQAQSLSYAFDEVERPTGGALAEYRPLARPNGATVEVNGTVTPGAAVTINGTSVAAPGGVFSRTYTPGAGWQSYTIQGILAGAGYNGSNAVAEEVRKVFVPPASETLSYDGNGNLQTDARWTASWNEADQLTALVESNPAPGVAALRLDFLYDYFGKRFEKKVSQGGTVLRRTTFLYDGWRLAREIEYDGTGAEKGRRVYTWGPDASGSLDGAAGVGGLIEILETRYGTTTRSMAIDDGMGNVRGTIDGTSGARMADFDYGPFGEGLAVAGPRAASCPLRFQTKYYDEETGFYYFGKRYYDPRAKAWLSKDPIREAGGVNLYAYNRSNPVGKVDPIGLASGSLFETMFSGHAGRDDLIRQGNETGLYAAYGIMGVPAEIVAHPKVQGSIRMAGGAFEAGAGGLFTADTGGLGGLLGGGLLVANGGDNFYAGLQTFRTDAYQPAFLERGITSLVGDGLLGNGLYMTTQLGMGGVPYGAARIPNIEMGIFNPLNYRVNPGELLMGVPRFSYSPANWTYLYQKVGPLGEHLKFGVTVNPVTRYTQEEFGGGSLRIIAQGPRPDMLRLEDNLHLTLPIGPEERQLFYIQKQSDMRLAPPPYEW